jgi:hypothetical protein
MLTAVQLVGPIKIKLTDGKQFEIEPGTTMERTRAKAFCCPSCDRINNLELYKLTVNNEVLCVFCGTVVGVAEW